MSRWKIESASERFWRNVKKTDSCWLWVGRDKSSGYGRFWETSPRKGWRAHRFAYTELVGPIPEGMTLDHLCEVRACVNPAHLVVATAVENTMRSGGSVGRVNAAKTHCPQGHAYTEQNILRLASRPTVRYCRACQRARNSSEKRKARRRELWALRR